MMKKLLLVPALMLAVLMACGGGTASATKSPSPSPSPTETPTPSPEPCVDYFTHLGSGAKLVTTGTVTSAYMAPNDTNEVFVFVGLAISGDSVSPAPTLTGMGVTWIQDGPFWKKPDGTTRSFTEFHAIGAVPGTLTFSDIPGAKTHVAWTVSQGGNTIIQEAVNPTGNLETSHSVTLNNPPTGAVVAGFMIGQQQPADDVPPYVTLGQSHTSFITAISEWDVDGPGDYQTASVVWPQPGHSLGIAIEVACV